MFSNIPRTNIFKYSKVVNILYLSLSQCLIQMCIKSKTGVTSPLDLSISNFLIVPFPDRCLLVPFDRQTVFSNPRFQSGALVLISLVPGHIADFFI